MKLNSEWVFKESPGPEVTAYTTTWNCIDGKYPIVQSISSFLWADKIVVVDGGSSDGTRQVLEELSKIHSNIEIYDIPIDEEMPGKDGHQKAMALAMCSTPFAIQFDIDEICIGNVSNWKKLLKEFPPNIDILSLPVFEPYGEIDKIRVNKEHTPWKWRIFKTKPEITHGIPKQDQLIVEGRKHSKGMSDGCFPIHVVTEEMYPHKMTKEAKEMTEVKNSGNLEQYKNVLIKLLGEETPAILHLGHLDLKSKIKHYLKSWHKWWCQLYNKDLSNSENNLYFPGHSIESVTQEMIEQKVEELIKKTSTVKIFYDK